MNLLSVLSLVTAQCFLAIAGYSLVANRKAPLNRVSALMHAGFAVWSLATVFYYAAETAADARFWYGLSSIGWVLFPAFALHYFLLRTDKAATSHYRPSLGLIYAMPALLLSRTLVQRFSVTAFHFVPSLWDGYWAYVPDSQSLWYWLYMVYLAVTLFSGFSMMARWARHRRPRERAAIRRVLVIDITVLLIGMTTDILLPLIGVRIPPIANLIILVYGLGFVREMRKSRLLSRTELITSEAILDTIVTPVLLLDESGRILRCNRATCDWLSLPSQRIIQRHFSEFLPGHRYGKRSLMRLISGRALRDVEMDIVDGNGATRRIVMSASTIDTDVLGFFGITVSLRDITERKAIEQELFRMKESYRMQADELFKMAHFDTLTGLPNRRLFFMRAIAFVVAYETDGRDFAVVFMDLNGFKHVNDLYGHAMGDMVLKETAARLSAVVEPEEFLARMGGDEFVLILRLSREIDEPDISSRTHDIRTRFADGIVIDGISLDVDLALGLASYGEDQDLDVALRKADERMYADKARMKQRTESIQV